MKRHGQMKALFLVLGMLLLLGLVPTAQAAEFSVCTRTGNQTDPAISGSKVVYTDESPGANHYQVYVYDIATKTEQAVSPATWTQDWAAIDGDTVAYVYYENGKLPWQVYYRNLTGGAAGPISTSSDNQGNVCVDGGVFVYTGGYQIYRKGPTDVAPVALTTVAKLYESEDALALDGTRVVFSCRSTATGGPHDLGVIPLSGGSITWLRQDPTKTLDASSPDISGDRVVWQDDRSGDYDIYLYDLAKGQEMRLTTATTDQTDPAICGNVVVWIDHPMNDAAGYVTSYDLVTGVTRRLSTLASAYDPDVCGSYVVWHDSRVMAPGGDYNIYGYDLSVPDTFTKWTKRASGTTQSILGLDFVSAKVGWAVGYGGTILKTTDAGVTWKAQTSGSTVELNDVDMVDGSTGWVVGYDRPNNAAVILKTANGGLTWVPQSYPTAAGAWPTDVLAVDATTAIGVGGGISAGQNLFWTQNGGATWLSHPNAPSGTNLFGVSRLVGTAAWAVGAQSGLIKTTSSGTTWSTVAHPTNGMERFTGVVAVDATTAVVVGDDEPTTTATGLILRTADGGTTWTSPSPPTTQQLREVDGSGGHLWIVGEGGVVYHSRDAGVTWGKQTVPPGTPALWNIDYRGPDLICAVGVNGTILTGMRPTATLSTPKVPLTVRRNAYFTTTGTLKPRHSGSTPLTFYRKVGTKWVKYRTVKAKNANYSTYTKYSLKYKLPYAGKWYVQAAHSCLEHRAGVSGKRYFTVK